MTDHLTVPGAEGTRVHLRRSARARRLSLRVGRTDGRVTLSLPARTPLAEARAFVVLQSGWIARAVAAVPPARLVRIGGTISLMGREVPVVVGGGRAASLEGDVIAVPDDARVPARVRALVKALARERLASAVDEHARALGRVPARLTLRDPRARWGSCSSRGDLMFSWRLVMAPPDVLDYVAAHEVAHLAHMDHSSRFWATVAALLPGYAPHRAWLRTQGAALHAVDFGPR